MEERFFKALTKLKEHGGDLQVKDYGYVYGEDITLVIVDKRGKYISFDLAEHLMNDKFMIASCVADMIGSVNKTMILKLKDKTIKDFKNEHSWVDLYKEV